MMDLEKIREDYDNISAGIIVKSGNEYLLGRVVQDLPRPWTVFKGTVEEAESILDGALRELWEESNIDVRNRQSEFPSLKIGPIHSYILKNKFVVLYLLDDPDKKLRNVELKCNSFFGDKNTPEITEYKWVAFDELQFSLMKSQLGIIDVLKELLKWLDKIIEKI